MRYLLALVILLTTLVPMPVQAQAVPPSAACGPGQPSIVDMAGIYESAVHRMRMRIFPCGLDLWWENQYGLHHAWYVPTARMAEGGFVARVVPEASTASLDDRLVLGVKPGTPGAIELLTMAPGAADLRFYRLQRTGNLYP